jgi:hypothetical protein
MKVQEFIEKYNANQRIDIAKALEVKKYVGIETKRMMAGLVLDNCMTVDNGEVYVDSLDRYILFTLAVIGIHTNLEFSTEDDDMNDAIEEYDALCESGLLVKVIDTFKDDYTSCQEILNMMTADRLQHSMTIEKKLGQFLDSIQNICGDAVNQLIAKLDINEIANMQLDTNNISELLNLIK